MRTYTVSRGRRTFPLLGVAVAIAALIALVGSPVSQAAARGSAPAATVSADWPGYLFNRGHSSFNRGATSITSTNAKLVAPGWKFTPDPPTMPGQPSALIQASPTVAGGRIYVGAETGEFYALDETTGTVVWKQFLGFVPKLTCGGARGITSTATVAPDPVTHNPTIYVAGGDGYLYALNTADGSVVWRSVIGIPSTTKSDYYDWGSPVVSRGHVYMGISSFCDGPLVHGGLKEYDQGSGALQATYFTLPPSAGVGGSIWTSPAAASDGSIFVSTGNGGTGVPPDADSIVRLAGSNLARLDGWQIPFAQQVKDGDFGGSPTLFNAILGGVTTGMVGACDKNGVYYALRRQSLSAGPVWTFKMADAYPLDGYTGQCDAAAIWDGSRLIEGGNGTTIGGKFYQGSVRSLDPATGTPLWETGLPAPVLGSPTEDGSGVVAAAVFVPGAQSGVWLLDATTGKVLKVLSTNGSEVFSQPVFAQNDLFLAGSPSLGVTEEHDPARGHGREA